MSKLSTLLWRKQLYASWQQIICEIKKKNDIYILVDQAVFELLIKKVLIILI